MSIGEFERGKGKGWLVEINNIWGYGYLVYKLIKSLWYIFKGGIWIEVLCVDGEWCF